MFCFLETQKLADGLIKNLFEFMMMEAEAALKETTEQRKCRIVDVLSGEEEENENDAPVIGDNGKISATSREKRDMSDRKGHATESNEEEEEDQEEECVISSKVRKKRRSAAAVKAEHLRDKKRRRRVMMEDSSEEEEMQIPNELEKNEEETKMKRKARKSLDEVLGHTPKKHKEKKVTGLSPTSELTTSTKNAAHPEFESMTLYVIIM
eukprot:m.215022 g.215022  ORF g.215022 m.215022 type:complete len:209 (+) comp39821_c1_seq39:300-926(+)